MSLILLLTLRQSVSCITHPTAKVSNSRLHRSVCSGVSLSPLACHMKIVKDITFPFMSSKRKQMKIYGVECTNTSYHVCRYLRSPFVREKKRHCLCYGPFLETCSGVSHFLRWEETFDCPSPVSNVLLRTLTCTFLKCISTNSPFMCSAFTTIVAMAVLLLHLYFSHSIQASHGDWISCSISKRLNEN